MLRFHLFNVQPGFTETQAGGATPKDPDLTAKDNKDFNKIELMMVDLRHEDEVLRWPLHLCGDGHFNATAFE